MIRLMTRSNLVGCSTGRSSGPRPFKILSQSRPLVGAGRGRLILGHQTSRIDVFAISVRRRQTRAQRQDCDQSPVGGYKRIAGDIERRLCIAPERLDNGRDVVDSPDSRCSSFAKRPGCCLYFTYVQHDTGIIDVGHDRQLAKSRDHFAQEFDLLASKIGCLVRQAGGVAPRARETDDQAIGDRISRDRENDCSALFRPRRPKWPSLQTPMTFLTADDPVTVGLVANFNRPGGNVTGVSFVSATLGTKRLELLRALAPKADVVAVRFWLRFGYPALTWLTCLIPAHRLRSPISFWGRSRSCSTL